MHRFIRSFALVLSALLVTPFAFASPTGSGQLSPDDESVLSLLPESNVVLIANFRRWRLSPYDEETTASSKMTKSEANWRRAKSLARRHVILDYAFAPCELLTLNGVQSASIDSLAYASFASNEQVGIGGVLPVNPVCLVRGQFSSEQFLSKLAGARKSDAMKGMVTFSLDSIPEEMRMRLSHMFEVSEDETLTAASVRPGVIALGAKLQVERVISVRDGKLGSAKANETLASPLRQTDPAAIMRIAGYRKLEKRDFERKDEASDSSEGSGKSVIYGDDGKPIVEDEGPDLSEGPATIRYGGSLFLAEKKWRALGFIETERDAVTEWIQKKFREGMAEMFEAERKRDEQIKTGEVINHVTEINEVMSKMRMAQVFAERKGTVEGNRINFSLGEKPIVFLLLFPLTGS